MAQDKCKKYGNGVDFVGPPVARTIVKAGPPLQANGHDSFQTMSRKLRFT